MKILIITNKLKTATIISNFITLNIHSDISILIANNIESAKLIFIEHNINLIIWENDIFNLNFYKNSLYFIPLIIVNDFYNNNAITLKNFKYVSLDNLTDLQYLLDKYISVSKTLDNTKQKILKELVYIGFNIKHNGTKYIMESILFFKFYYKANTVKDIYSIIAQKYNTTSNNIKSNIIKSINYMYCESEFSKLQTYFSLVEDKKPTPKQIILTVLKNI